MARSPRKRDFLYIALAIGGLFGAMFLYFGVWPPVSTIETNSMMHVNRFEYTVREGTTHAADVGFGRLGTIDPGDIIFIKKVDRPEDIETFARSIERHYKMPGHVVAYRHTVNDAEQIIVHRAMTYVEIQGTGASKSYRVWWNDAWEEQGSCVRQPVYTCRFDADEGVTIEELLITDRQFKWSGFITKGDNNAPRSNPGADQATAESIAPEPIPFDKIVGVAQGEIPAIGLLRVAFTGQTIRNAEMQDHPYFMRIGNVVAPIDLWLTVLIELVILAALPIAYAVVRDLWSKPSREVAPELSVLERAYNEAQAQRRPAAKPEPRSGESEKGVG